jgi:hypothetical protein
MGLGVMAPTTNEPTTGTRRSLRPKAPSTDTLSNSLSAPANPIAPLLSPSTEAHNSLDLAQMSLDSTHSLDTHDDEEIEDEEVHYEGLALDNSNGGQGTKKRRRLSTDGG